MTTGVHKMIKAALLLTTAAALVFPATAGAVGGSYVIAGGNTDQRAQVDGALRASKFNWSAVPVTVKITLAAGIPTQATPGTIQIDTKLLDTGKFAWGIVQHEYAHQVDWYVLRPHVRAALAGKLGGVTWGVGITSGAEHDQQSGERFADQLSWAFWPSADNAIGQTSGAFTAKSFRGFLGLLLKPEPAAPGLLAIAPPTTTVTGGIPQ